MSHRAEQLYTAADEQIAELIELLANADEEALQRPCPGREKFGDGTIAAIAAHTALNYQRIGTFVATSQDMSGRHAGGEQPRHRIPGFLRALGHAAPAHDNQHEDGLAARTTDPREIVDRLTAARGGLGRIAQLTEQQLDRVPPKDSFRFCDGQRTLDQVLTGMLKHQDHQVQAVRAALVPAP